MEAPRGRSRRGRAPAPCSSSSAEAAARTCATPATSCSWPKGQKPRSTLAAIAGIGSHMHSITPPSSRQGTPEAAELNSGKIDPAESKPFTNDRPYPTPPGKSFASGTLRDCCCHSQTNVSTLEALHQLKEVLITREPSYQIDQQYMIRHPKLEARMRRILFDWLMEVCEVMVLRRETFHLAVNLFDRYMSLKRDIHKEGLQLIGVTCLFITGKLEEIYPPKASAFAYVTDHLNDEEIRAMELDILVTVKFRLNAVTANTWVAVWMLYMHTEDAASTSEYDAKLFVRVMELIDLALCDMECLQYTNQTLALAAFYIVTKNWSLPASLGFRYCDVQKCAEWLTSYYAVMTVYGPGASVKSFDDVPENEVLNIQDHKYSIEDFVAGRDGPKQALAPPDLIFTALLVPKSLGFHQCGTPGVLTPDHLSEDACA